MIVIVAIAAVVAATGIFIISPGAPEQPNDVQSTTGTQTATTLQSTSTTTNYTAVTHTTGTPIIVSQTSESQIEVGFKPSKLVFGDNSRNYTEIPIAANTMVWTTWTINSIAPVDQVVVGVLEPSQNANSNVTVFAYINGRLYATKHTS